MVLVLNPSTWSLLLILQQTNGFIWLWVKTNGIPFWGSTTHWFRAQLGRSPDRPQTRRLLSLAEEDLYSRRGVALEAAVGPLPARGLLARSPLWEGGELGLEWPQKF